ncbi:MAG: ATP phosphoribosyltransferase regulatory subunit [Chloroflexi bacterium]|jgi:ATP phosphoribosyltransferase regulatory subunit|nr:ATP phosphoribosyltransferase regulatory subunit [Chloroflexota bacterium]
MTQQGYALDRQLPHGLTDLFFEQAAAKVALERILEETFQRWGYTRIIPPTFEYYESLATEVSPQIQEDMYRFFDREGHILALRPDMTVPVARVVATKLYDQELPLRLYYVGNVFRYEEPQAGRRREFTQAGIELVGAGTPEADAEVVAVAVAALRAMGVTNFQINLGQVAFLQAILSEIGLTNGASRRLEQAIDRKNDVELRMVLADLGITGDVASAIHAIPHLCGGREVLQQARRLAINAAARQAIDYLEAVYALLQVENVAEHVILDLGEIRHMAYYTGISFLGYVEGLGFPICGGGRYDTLIARFGQSLPAVGFALGVERSLLVTRPQVNIASDVVMQSCQHAGCRALAQAARNRGLRVTVDVLHCDEETLISHARRLGAPRVICCRGEGRCLLVEGDTRRELSYTAIEEAMDTWNR